MPISREATVWGMKFLLDQDADDAAMVDLRSNLYDSVEHMRDDFLRTTEARGLFRAANGDADGPAKTYMIPPFLLRRPASPAIQWRFEEPSLDEPVCQLCTYDQMQTETYRRICTSLGLEPGAAHRKVWEFVFILAALEAKGMLVPGKRALGFGTGTEQLPSLFAKAGVTVVATDAPADLDFSDNWKRGAQWAEGLADLWHPNLVKKKTFFDRVSFQHADMNNISPDFVDFDFCWSACAFEHLGSIRKGLDYLHNSLKPLKPGGVSVQTTEINLMSNDATVEMPGLCIFRKQDIELVIEELTAAGHKVEPLNLWPGADPLDEHIDLPPYSEPHLKLEMTGHVATSIGLIITKGG